MLHMIFCVHTHTYILIYARPYANLLYFFREFTDNFLHLHMDEPLGFCKYGANDIANKRTRILRAPDMTFPEKKRASFPVERVNFANADEICPLITVVAAGLLDSRITTRKSGGIVERYRAENLIEVKEHP